MNKQWYYVENGDKKGPYPANELKGKIEKDSLLWSEGMKDWEKAEQISEFKSLFEVTPPPIPGSKEANSNTYSRITNSVFYAWTFAVLCIVICILELTGHEDWKYYSFAIFLSGTALVRIFLGLRGYFSKILQNKSLSRTTGWLIASVIPIYLIMVFTSKDGFEDRISEEASIVMFVLLIIVLIVHVYQFMQLRRKLSGQMATGLKELRTFATLQLILFPLGLIFTIIFEEENSMTILNTILELMPVCFLIMGLQKIEDRVVPKVA